MFAGSVEERFRVKNEKFDDIDSRFPSIMSTTSTTSIVSLSDFDVAVVTIVSFTSALKRGEFVLCWPQFVEFF